MDDPETHELIAHFAGLVAQRAWGTVVLEQVPAFFDSTAWEMVLGRATAAGYLLVGVVKVDVRDCGLYQARTRCIAVLTLRGRRSTTSRAACARSPRWRRRSRSASPTTL